MERTKKERGLRIDSNDMLAVIATKFHDLTISKMLPSRFNDILEMQNATQHPRIYPARTMTTPGSVISQPADSKDGRASVDRSPPGGQSLKPGHVCSSAAAVRRALLTLAVERNERERHVASVASVPQRPCFEHCHKYRSTVADAWVGSGRMPCDAEPFVISLPGRPQRQSIGGRIS